ncbi:MAG: membrane protease YdiL (CAAX protease family) [Paracoccaceae bacterium]|jgi:membrane protease YdiL (CAAX protease family)
MPLSLTLAFLWVVVALVLALLPSKRNHWPAAYGLIVVGVPILGYVTYENGPMIGLVCLAAGASVLRWPLMYLGRYLRRRFRT